MSPKKKNKSLWIIKSIAITFALSCFFGVLAEFLMKKSHTIVAIVIIICIIGIGVAFDIVGVALAASDKPRFYAMSAKKVYAAKQCVFMVKNADILSNVCNDIIGDICGIISGASGAVIALRIATSENGNFIISIIISGVIAALTVGGKAFGKRVGLSKSNDIVLLVGKSIAFFSTKRNSHR